MAEIKMYTKKQFTYRTQLFIVIGYLLFFCLASVALIVFLYFEYSQLQNPGENTLATHLPPITPSPHIPLTNQPKGLEIFEESFSDNHNRWTSTSDLYRVQVMNGKLYFESLDKAHYAITDCGSCPILKEPYYLEADLRTGVATDQSFGIVFNLNRSNHNFHLFQINTEAKRYYLYHHIDDHWSLVAAGESNQIKAFPAVNTLGIYANADSVELYINGGIIDSYVRSGYVFQSGGFGFYLEHTDFRVIIDNLSITKVGMK